MDATLFLCDWAEEVKGKLYIMGAGWTRIVANQPVNIAAAVLVVVPWEATNQPHTFRGFFMTEDENPVLSSEGEPVEVGGKMEMGRPAGARPGAPFNAPLALRFSGIQFAPGAHSFRVEVNGTELTRAVFDAVEGEL